MMYGHLYHKPVGDWQPKVGDKVVWRQKWGSMIREGRIITIGGKFYLVEIKFNMDGYLKTKQVHAEIEDIRPIGK